MNTAKYKFYSFYLTNKKLEVFLNTFWWIQIKAKIDDSQALDILNEKLSVEFKDCLVTLKKTKNLNEFITSLRNIDAIVKQMCKQSYVCAQLVSPITSTTKPLLKIKNSTPIKPFFPVKVTVATFWLIIQTKIFSSPIDFSSTGRSGLILQIEKNCLKSLGLCVYYKKVAHIAIDQRNLTLLVSKRRVEGIRNFLIALVSYNSSAIEEKELSES